MNKTAIKNFAVWARNKLIADITYKAGLLGITDKEIKSPLQQSTSGVQFFDIGTREPYSITGIEIEQRRNLAEVIANKTVQSDYQTARNNVIEEVAYTWFNRLIAVRFMEVNDYIPSRTRVLSSESPTKNEPDIVTSPFDSELDFTVLEREHILHLKNDNQLDALFRMLFIKQCNTLNEVLPELFEKTNDYTELLLNVSFTDKDGVVYHLIHDIPEHDFNVEKEGQVEIIGWMYQYYNTEPKDETFALLKKNVKITKERIPAATQLFTPDWIVRYMVENSLGRLWIEGHPNDDLKSEWKYYLDESEQEPEVQIQLNAIREEYKSIKPEDIKVIDPCMGSGHILVYAFDVLMQIYESYGYSQRDAAKSIVENNLYGLDIDNRSYQLTYFAVMMKARQYNRRILNGETRCNVYAIQESNGINREHLKYFGEGMSDLEQVTALSQMGYLLDTMHDAKEYGSILNVDNLTWELLNLFIENTGYNGQVTMETFGLEETQKQLHELVEIAAVLAKKYDVVVTNPPYMGSSGMNTKLSDFVKIYYPESKTDMSTVFMENNTHLCKKFGYISMINIPVWMFLSSYEKLRNKMISQNTFINMVHFGRGVFGSDFGTTSFVVQKQYISNYTASYRRLFEKQGAVDSVEQKEQWFLDGFGRHLAKQENFSKIPGMPIAYWVSKQYYGLFSQNSLLADSLKICQGMKTADNNRFLRLWHEVSTERLYFYCPSSEEAMNSHKRWFPYNKGGEFRKWYGNRDYIVNWEFNGSEIKNYPKSFVRNERYFFNESLTWSLISSSNFGIRYCPTGAIFDGNGSSIFASKELLLYALAFLCSNVANKLLKILSPTMTFEIGQLSRLPFIIQQIDEVVSLVQNNIEISQKEWDSYETSWDFVRHPFFTFNEYNRLSNTYYNWEKFTISQFEKMKSNEENSNRIFIDTYDLEDELTPEIADKDVTIRKADLNRDIRSFLSYAVGCIFGRYSLDVGGLAYAGGEWDNSKYSTFIPDQDSIIPFTDEEYFEDDVVGLLCAFLKKSFGIETMEENLDFIAKVLGNKGNTSREVIRNYFLKDFFKDHCKIYQKRPIYWLFDSGKTDGFKALVYMHRYDANTIGNLRIDYLHQMQRVYDSEITRMQETIDNSSNAREVAAATKRKEKLTKQLKETKEYDEKIAHLALARISIDLDDGVNVNYDKVQMDNDGNKLDVLAKI